MNWAEMDRRQWLRTAAGITAAGCLGAMTTPGRAKPASGALLRSRHFDVREFNVGGDPKIGDRFTLLTPKHTQARVPLLVLLHGLGETSDPRAGAYAWLERYGLGNAYARLVQAPLHASVHGPTKTSRHWPAGRLVAVNALLQQQPFRGMAIACPYTPNVYKSRDRKTTLDAYTQWLRDRVIPRARQEAHVFEDAAHTFLDGCSLGGYVGIEVFLRAPDAFCAWGSVQGALGQHRIDGYAKRLAATIAKHGPRHIHLETSSADAFRGLNERFSKLLHKAGVEHDFRMLQGPHNQPFLRDSGTPEMLLWHDRLPR